MRIVRLTACCTLIAAILPLASSQVTAAEKLSDILREHKWDGIIGTWVDAETQGKTTYAWKIKDRVVEITTTGADKKKTVSLMGVNAKTGEVFHMGADSEGGSSLGKWEVDDKGDAVLEILFTTGDGEQGTLSMRHHWKDQDTIILTIELPEPIKFTMIRTEPKK